MIKKTISSIVRDDLCTGCGTCVSLCPHNAINLTIDAYKGTYVPKADLDRCNNCGICRLVCPGGELDFNELNIELFGKKSEDDLLGNYIKCYIGHSKDEVIRYNSSSGGLITSLLIFALEERIIDGALVTRMKKDRPLEPEPFIARTREEIIEASKSKYCPVPANIALKKILEANDGERFAVVGLPCHIQGIRKAQKYNKKLQKRISICLALLCAHADNFHASKFVLNKWDIDPLDIEAIDYRGHGWPGSMIVRLNDKTTKEIPFKKYINIFHSYSFFTPQRCLICSDATGELGDIAFGDAWGLSKDECKNNGLSIILTRTKIAEELICRMENEKKIFIEETGKENIIKSQRGLLYTKKIGLKARYDILRLIGKNVPDIDVYSCGSNRIIPFFSLLLYVNSLLCLNRFCIKILKFFPHKILYYYGSIPQGMAYLWSREWTKNREVE